MTITLVDYTQQKVVIMSKSCNLLQREQATILKRDFSSFCEMLSQGIYYNAGFSQGRESYLM